MRIECVGMEENMEFWENSEALLCRQVVELTPRRRTRRENMQRPRQ
jgi:hypothetical protein